MGGFSSYPRTPRSQIRMHALTDGDVEDEVEGLVEGRGVGAALPGVAGALDPPEVAPLPEGLVELHLQDALVVRVQVRVQLVLRPERGWQRETVQGRGEE